MRGVRKWTHRATRELFEHALFRLEEQTVEADDGDQRTVLVMHPSDWVNVIAISEDNQVLLVRQWRFGSSTESLEIPGGVVETGEPELDAAQREMLEETGYRADRWTRLGEVEPNPAFQSNRCGTWLAEDLEEVGDPEGDGEEEISVEWCSLEEIPALIDQGAIRHSLVLAAFYLHGRHRR